MRIYLFNSKRQQRYSDCEVFMEILLVVSLVFFIVGIVHPALALTVAALLVAALSLLSILYFKGRAIIEQQGNDRPEA